MFELWRVLEPCNETAPGFSVAVNDGTVDSNTLAATINYTPTQIIPIAPSDTGLSRIEAPASEQTQEESSGSNIPADIVMDVQPVIRHVAMTDTIRPMTVQADLHPSVKSPTNLFNNAQPKHREALTNQSTDDEILQHILDIIRAEQQLSGAHHNHTASTIHVEIKQEDGFRVDVLTNGVKITTVSLSVGAVGWALRASGLFTSVLTSLPAWRSFDVLPVLSRENDEEDDASWEYDKDKDDGTPNDERKQ